MIRIIFLLLCAAVTLSPALVLSAPVTLAPNAPDTYTVKRGDTLWGISGRFLQQPWRWPEVWRVNRDQIRNPHLIYPGQVIVLDRSGPYLSIGRRIGDGKLTPKVYSESLDAAIPSIPMADIEPFLTRPLVFEEEDMNEAGTIVATENQRVISGNGDAIFAKSLASDGDTWQIVRKAQPIIDPVTQETLAWEAQYLGLARLLKKGEPPVPADNEQGNERVLEVPATLQIISAEEEVSPGDRLLRNEDPRVLTYMPHAPESDIEGRLIALHDGVHETGRHHVVTLNIGANDGLEVGHVLALHRERGIATYDGDGKKERFDLPDQRYGVAFVFRVFNRVAYALVMDVDGQVTLGDLVRKP